MQLAGSSGTVSPAADIYSLGCCLAAVSAQSRGTGTSSGEAPAIFGLLKKGVNKHTDLSAFAPQELHSLLKVWCLPCNGNLHHRCSKALFSAYSTASEICRMCTLLIKLYLDAKNCGHC